MTNIYRMFIVIAFLFFFGGLLGWFIELFYRRFLSKANPQRQWLNPGFLSGPWLPLYGCGVVVLYILSIGEQFVLNLDSGGIGHYIIMFIVMSFFMTLIEYIAGVIFINGMHIKLWDYSNEKWNIKGIICPKFTVFWGILSLLYYFLLFPHIHALVLWFIEHPWFSFTVGTFFGLFIVDCAHSLKLGSLMRVTAAKIDEKATVDFQLLQRKLKLEELSVHNFATLSSSLDKFEKFLKRSPGR